MTCAPVNFSPWIRITGEGGTDGKDLHVNTCMCGSAYYCECVVDSSSASASLSIIILYT